VGLLALLYGADLLQGLIGTPFTVHALWPMMNQAGWGEGASAFVLEAPWNLAQTAVLMLLSVVALSGGLICLGRRRGAARIGGLLALLAVVLPLTLPLLLYPFIMLMRGAGPAAPEWQMTLVYIGLPSLVSASGLVFGLSAAILLARAQPRASRRAGMLASAVGVVLGAVFVLEAVAALIRQITEFSSWWGVAWSGLLGTDPVVALLLCLLLVVVMVAAGIGSGLLLGASSLPARIGGGLLAAALLVRVATQVTTWGMGHYLQIRASQMFDYTWIWAIEWSNMVAVLVLAVPGLLLAIIGLFTGPRRAPTAAGGPSGPGGPSTSGGSSAL